MAIIYATTQAEENYMLYFTNQELLYVMQYTFIYEYLQYLKQTIHFFLFNRLNPGSSYYRGHTDSTWINWAAVTYGWVGYITLHWPTWRLAVNWFFGHVQALFV